MKTKNHKNEIKKDMNEFATLMALHVDEIHIQPRHLFRNKNCVHGPSRDDPKQLAKSVLVFLLSTLTGEKNQ